MKAVGIIPARYNSTRFPGKLLVKVKGKSILQHVYDRAKQAKSLDSIIIATGDMKIFRDIMEFTDNIYLNLSKHDSGTSRVAEVAKTLKDVNIIVNIQGDEPLIHPTMIDALVETMKKNEQLQVATIVKKITNPEDLHYANIVKVAVEKGYATWFGRHHLASYKHIGIYAYRKDFLLKLINLPKSKKEEQESLEQYRILDNNYKIKAIETSYDTVAIDRPDDLKKFKRILLRK